MAGTTSPSHWYAIGTHKRGERVLHEQLRASGFETLLPLHHRLSRWKECQKVVQWPICPGFCLARLKAEQLPEVARSPRVMEIVGSHGRPQPIPEEAIRALQRLLHSHTRCTSVPYQEGGPLVEVIRGPLQGLQGRWFTMNGQSYLVISIALIRCAAAVRLDADILAPVQDAMQTAHAWPIAQ